MFSPTTIASSTTIPSTRMKANSDITLIVTSTYGSRASAPMNETAMPTDTQRASRSFRNRASTRNTSRRPSRPLSSSTRSRSCSGTVSSSQVVIDRPGGSVADRSATKPLT